MIKNVKLKTVGVTFTNEDGVNRQDIIKELTPYSVVMLRREPTNRFDTNAIAIFTNVGQVGYIGKDYSSILAPMMDAGTEFKCQIAEIGEYNGTRYLHILINEVE